MKEYNEICIIDSMYVLLIYLLLKKNYKKTLFILGRGITLNSNLISSKKIQLIRGVSSNINNLFYYVYFALIFRKYKNRIEVYGQDHIIGSSFFIQNFRFFLIEDGLSFYSKYISELFFKYETEGIFSKLERKIFKLIKHHGLDERIQGVYFSGIQDIPKVYPKEKILYFNMRELWRKKSLDEQEEILRIFNCDAKILSYDLDDVTLLLTQPLSEDNYISEEEKLKIYSEIMDKITTKNILLKPHPREKTNYMILEKENCYIMEKNFPIELLQLLEIKLEEVVTLFSTGIYSFNNIRKKIYGTYKNEKLEKNFGIIEEKNIY